MEGGASAIPQRPVLRDSGVASSIPQPLNETVTQMSGGSMTTEGRLQRMFGAAVVKEPPEPINLEEETAKIVKNLAEAAAKFENKKRANLI